MLRYANPITPSTVLVKREAILQLGGFRDGISGCEDWEMWFRLQQLGQFEAIADPLVDYYLYPKSLSSNPGRMLQTLDRFIETTLLADLHGFDRWVWRRRIRSVQALSSGLIARENGLDSETHYMLQSLRIWPSPFWQPGRFLMFAVSAKNRMTKRLRSE
jgi:hypothetical protein